MRDESAIDAIARRNHEWLLADNREAERRERVQLEQFYAEEMTRELAEHGPDRPVWTGRIRVPPGMVGRDEGLQALRIRCYARIMARNRVRQKRAWERYSSGGSSW